MQISYLIHVLWEIFHTCELIMFCMISVLYCTREKLKKKESNVGMLLMITGELVARVITQT